INLGNVDPILWAAYGAALAYPGVRGIGFMSVTLVKLWGAWPLLFALVRREWRTVVTAVATFVVACAAVSLVLGPAEFANAFYSWFRHMLPAAGQGSFNPYNVSIPTAVLRVARELGWEYTTG